MHHMRNTHPYFRHIQRFNNNYYPEGLKMSEKQPSPLPFPNAHCIISGIIKSSRTTDSGIFTHIVTPAPDPYSRPQNFEVKSQNKLGTVDSIVTIECMLNGFIKTFKYSKDGKMVEGTEARVSLEYVQ